MAYIFLDNNYKLHQHPVVFKPSFIPLFALMTRFSLLSLFSMAVAALCPQAIADAPNVCIATFQGGRAAAISYTFDDGLRDQATLAAPMLERAGFRGTFFIIASLVPDTEEEAAAKKPGTKGGISWPRLKEMSEHGHEISNHTWSHHNLIKLDDAALKDEIDKADQCITEKIGIFPPTLAYPGNGHDDRVRTAALCNHLATRDTCTGFGKPDFTAEKANAWADEKISKRQWGVVMIHGIETGYDAFSSAQVLQDHLDYVKAHTDQIWVDTFANIARYVQERDSATLTSTVKPHEVTCAMECPPTPPEKLSQPESVRTLNAPLTVVIEVRGAVKAQALRAGQSLPVRMEPDRICVDWIPGPTPVTITWQ